MSDLNFYLNNVLAPPPNDWQGLEVECSFENNSPDATVKTTTFEWLGEDAETLNTWIKRGQVGWYGLFEGTPFKITACSPSVTLFDGCVDYTSQDTTFQCDVVKANVKETQRIQFLNDRAESFSFSYLYNSVGSITRGDFVAVPYVISVIPDYLQVALLVITFIEMVKLIRDSIETVVGYIQAAIGATIWWLIAIYIALAIAAIAYSLFLTLLMVNTLKMLINELVQPIKFKYGMRVSTLFEKGCSYLGLGFSSTILQGQYRNLVIIPQKKAYYHQVETPDQYINEIFGQTSNRKVYDEAQNPTAYGYYEGTFAQLIREMCDVFNAKVVIRNNILFFERWDFWNNNSVFTMPNQSSESPFDDPYGTNANEITSNYLLSFILDSSDTNTYDRYDGTSCQMTLAPVAVSNVKNVLLKGLTDKRLNYALAKRKQELTVVEDVVNYLLASLTPFYQTLGVWDNWFSIHALPALPNYVSNNRIGAMLLSSDFTDVQKLLLVEDKPTLWNTIDNGLVSCFKVDIDNSRADHLGYTDAFRLMREFHSASWAINTLASPVQYPNQYLTYKDKEVPMCCGDFVSLKNNNIIQTYDNKKGRLDSMRWNPFTETAHVDFRVKQVYTKNLKQSFVIDGQPM